MLKEMGKGWLEVHEKLAKYMSLIAVPRIDKIKALLESNSHLAHLSSVLQEITMHEKEMEKTGEELVELRMKMREIKEAIAGVNNDTKQLSKHLDTQITLNNLIFEKENLLDERTAELTNVVRQSIRPIKAQAFEYYKENVQEQIQLYDCMHGVVYFVKSVWEQLMGVGKKFSCAVDSAASENKHAAALLKLKTDVHESVELVEEKNSSREDKDNPFELSFSQRELNPNPENNKEEIIQRRFSKSLMSMNNRSATPILRCSLPLEFQDKTLPKSPRKRDSFFDSNGSKQRNSRLDDNVPMQRNATWLHKKFGVNEEIMGSFACALSWKILLQGRLHVTAHHICFRSFFNNATLFGSQTKIVIPFTDIEDIKKSYNAWIFNNSISICTKDAEFFFTSFVYRDRAYELLRKCASSVKNLPEDVVSCREESKAICLEDTPSLLKELSELEERRMARAKEEGLQPRTSSTEIIQDEEYECPMQVLFPAVAVNTHKVYRQCDELSDNIGLVVSQQVQHPEVFTKYKKALAVYLKESAERQESYVKEMERMPLKATQKRSFTHLLKGQLPIPFMPNQCSMEEDWEYYYLSPNYVVIHKRGTTSGIPYSDYFHTNTQVHIKQTVHFKDSVARFKTRVATYVFIEFVKTTMLRSKIESETFSQTKFLQSAKIAPLFKEYVAQEAPAFASFIENFSAENSSPIVPYTPLVPSIGIENAVLRDIRDKERHLKLVNDAIIKYKKRLYIEMVVIVVLLYAVFTFISRTVLK
eukprot:TRINITY_DN2992_c0_g1_i7.p1 TRINITY_DN2992_c0_g1~~TRINITY_DN2992_c0_g1_i7.p1  ORF type:complete len:759 (+),score=199.05 TRINITY_DN2992_c0_g1_i7:245-2521(+)